MEKTHLRNYIIMVSGLPQSGTSMMMQIHKKFLSKQTEDTVRSKASPL